MENSPQCMIYIPWKTESMNEDTILFGDDQGRFKLKVFSQKNCVTFMKSEETKIQIILAYSVRVYLSFIYFVPDFLPQKSRLNAAVFF